MRYPRVAAGHQYSPAVVMRRLGDADRRRAFAYRTDGDLVRVADELPRAVLPGIAQREFAARVARNPQRLHAGGTEILVQHTDRIVADDVLGPGHRKCGDRNAAR